jgi:transcriptional regulator with XRE-family HTH domain
VSHHIIGSCASSGFAHRLKAYLYGSGYTRQDISMGTGIPEKLLTEYVNGSTQPILSDIEKIAHFMQVNPAWLAFRIGERKLPSEAELITPYLNDADLTAEQLEEKYRQAGKTSIRCSGRRPGHSRSARTTRFSTTGPGWRFGSAAPSASARPTTEEDGGSPLLLLAGCLARASGPAPMGESHRGGNCGTALQAADRISNLCGL